MKEDKYNVRISFDHGNEIRLDLKGSGRVHIKPGYDYFFENAPMQFINYLVQLRRLGVTYKITSDKRGCYQTFNLASYFSNDPYHKLGAVRKEKQVTLSEFTRKEKEEQEEVEVIDTTEGSEEDIVDGTITIDESELVPLKETTEEPEAENEEVATEPEKEEGVEDTPEEEEIPEESAVEEEPVDIESLSKPDLLAYARKLEVEGVEDYWTKKEIKEAIYKLSDKK